MGIAATLVERLPTPLRPYAKLMRLHQPVGIGLLLWPGLWGICLASRRPSDAGLLLLFLLGATVMRGAGCTINDILDRDVDPHVARTQTRPLASGAVTLTHAITFLVLQLGIGLVILLQLPPLAILLGCLAVPMVATYPLMKRITYWPQAFLGLTFNLSALIGYAAVAQSLPSDALLLYASAFFWTLGYDTIYAHQDKADDLLIGVKSTALKLGERTRPALVLIYGASASLLWASLWLAGTAGIGYLGAGFFTCHLIWQIIRLEIDNPKRSLKLFKSNNISGMVLFICLYLEKFV